MKKQTDDDHAAAYVSAFAAMIPASIAAYYCVKGEWAAVAASLPFLFFFVASFVLFVMAKGEDR